ncbi:MAG: hypothetical protein LQ338_004448, partial [Usnochroma carphineum]
MEGEQARSALKTVYDEILLAFEEASDKAEDLASLEPSSQLREAIIWLENATASLISWGIDIRADAGSLAAIEGTPLETEVRCALCELRIHLDEVFDERSSRSVSHSSDSPGFALSSDPKQGESAADEDPMAIMSGLISVLQDFVRPIRMRHASITGEGPYRNLKHQIDIIYNQHIESRDRTLSKNDEVSSTIERMHAGQVQAYPSSQSGESTIKRPLGSLILMLIGRPRRTETSPPRPNPSSTVPFRRDRHFVDRDILRQIRQKCLEPASRVVLVGLGGVGKSQLAIEYSYQVREQDPSTWVFWVYASNEARFEEGYRTIADRVKLPYQDEPGADVMRLVSDWLCDEANGRWIIILDNFDDPAVLTRPYEVRLRTDAGNSTLEAISLSSFLPKSQNGSILATSRNRNAAFQLVGSDRNIITIEPMDRFHAVRLLRNKIDGQIDEGDAIRLVQALDCMPLAISQAAAYINQRAPRMTIARYLDSFRKNDQDQASLLNQDAGDIRRDRSADNSIISSWHTSFRHILQHRPSAAQLLSLMSLFDRQGIPEWLLHRCFENDPSEVGSTVDLDTNLADDINIVFKEDISTLTNFCLIRKTNLEGGLFDMHRLVQLSTRRWLELFGDLERWTTRYIRMMSEVFPSGEYETWTLCRALLPHAEVMVRYQPADRQDLLCWTAVLNRAGWYAAATGNYSTAEAMHREALEGSEKAFGKGHPDTLTSVSNLALGLHYQGKYAAAEELNRRALEGREEALGKEHPDTLISVSNLAGVFDYQGKHEAAEELNRRALEGREKALGKEHPDTLTSVNNLALGLHYQGKYGAAKELYRRALEGRGKALGKEHPATLTSVSNLAVMLSDQGKYKAAEELYRQALEGREEALGKEHPATLTSVSNLAVMLSDQGKYEAAEKTNRQALEGKEKTLGKEHPDTLLSVYNLAYCQHQQKQYKEAKALYQRAYAGLQTALGANHPHTMLCSENYSSVLEESETAHLNATEQTRANTSADDKDEGSVASSRITTTDQNIKAGRITKYERALTAITRPHLPSRLTVKKKKTKQ